MPRTLTWSWSPVTSTAAGYREEFEYARERLDRIEAREVVYVPGNHDARSVGYLHYEDLFGERADAHTFEAPEGKVQVVCVDSSKPDLDDGEIGRELYGWILDSFSGSAALRIFVMHHHLVAIPGTGRDRNQVWDAGDALEILRSVGVDIVLGGHRHVPTYGRWRDCSWSTPAQRPRTGCAATPGPPTTSSR